MSRSRSVRTLRPGDVADCSRILYSLPDWFGMEESNRAYIDSLRTSAGAVAVEGDDIVGFIALVQHTDDSIRTPLRVAYVVGTGECIENTSSKPFRFLVFGERTTDDVVFYPGGPIMLVKSARGAQQYKYEKNVVDQN